VVDLAAEEVDAGHACHRVNDHCHRLAFV
jgi:hypothetical protein